MTVARWTVWVEVARPDGTSKRHEVGSVQRSLSSPDESGTDLGAESVRQAARRS